jgi:hypothetical protein
MEGNLSESVPRVPQAGGASTIRWQTRRGYGGTRADQRSSVGPILVRPSPALPAWTVPCRGVAAGGVPTRVMTGRPTASDPTSSVPLPPAVTNVGDILDGASSNNQGVNLGVRQRQRKRTTRQGTNCAQNRESTKNSEHYSAHPNLPAVAITILIKQNLGRNANVGKLGRSLRGRNIVESGNLALIWRGACTEFG